MRYPLNGKEPEDNWTLRYQNFFTNLFINFFHHPHFGWRLTDILSYDRLHYLSKRKFPDLIMILNIDGINPPVPVPQTVKFVYPKYKQ